MKKLLTALCLLTALPVLAVNGPPPIPAAPATQPGESVQLPTPDEQVRVALEKLIAFMNQSDKRPPDSEVEKFLDTEISPFFDWDYMARIAGGRLYTLRFNDYQKHALAEDMKHRFLTQITLRLTKWGRYHVRFLPTRVSPQGDSAVVTVQIMEPARLRPAEIQLQLHFNRYGWAIVDIVGNGVSAVYWYHQQLLLEARYQNYTRRRQ